MAIADTKHQPATREKPADQTCSTNGTDKDGACCGSGIDLMSEVSVPAKSGSGHKAHNHKHDHSHKHDHGHKHDHSKSDEDGCCASGVDLTSETAGGSGPYRYAFSVQGLDCAEEVSILRRQVGPLVGGGDRLAFDVLNGRMMVLDTAKTVSVDAVRKAVSGTGMSAVQWDPDDLEAKKAAEKHQRTQTLYTVFSGLAVLAGLVTHAVVAGSFSEVVRLFGDHAGGPTPVPEAIAYTVAIVLGARYIVVKAYHSAKSLRPDMNLLMIIAVTGAVIIGEWFEGAVISFLFALSLLLESWSVGRARRAIAKLLDLAPPTVLLLLGAGREKEVDAGTVEPGARFLVKPGDKFPLDGLILEGASSVNQAPITGESVPVTKEPGDEVFAGTINGEGALEVQSTKAAKDTTLARIIRMIEEAQGRRARAEQWVEKFALIYTPLVMVAAIVVFLVPPMMFGGEWADWFYRALVLLVIACPCALVISTPVSIVSALAASARQGVLVKGGIYMEQPAHLKAIAFDKTGTLTKGEPAVVKVIAMGNHTPDEVLQRASALEARSTHPLAEAILARTQSAGLEVTAAEEVKVLPGKGVTGLLNGVEYWLGSNRYLLERGQQTDEIIARAEELEKGGNSVVVVGNGEHVCGLIALADTVRPSARQVIADLRARGIEHLIMLTGDNRATGEAIAAQVGIDEVHAELLPEDKVKAVEQLVEKYGTVAMVGDGVNDAPAMARASFGIAMGAMGSDAAIETADVALMTDDLSKLPWLVGHSKRTLGIIRQNIVFSLGVKAVFVVLTFAGFATLWGAIAADVGASLLVVANAMRLLRV
ncbi:MAG: heavy metal translocating P-type ATPase [Alphaproteobacteria bacterium]|nr:heavy metal translocating P-type ATPase [Alphaproteobacteria bacterium]